VPDWNSNPPDFAALLALWDAYGDNARTDLPALYAALYKAVREFDGSNWAKLARTLDATAEPPLVVGKVVIPTPTVLTDGVRTETPPKQWRSNPGLAYLTLIVTLSLTLLVATYGVLGPEAWHELRDDTAWLLAIYGVAYAATRGGNRK
jgi:hypothetical protein